jgi:hypothetical protein
VIALAPKVLRISECAALEVTLYVPAGRTFLLTVKLNGTFARMSAAATGAGSGQRLHAEDHREARTLQDLGLLLGCAVWPSRSTGVHGPTVSITNANTSQPRFTAPNVSSTTTLSFELKVTDNNGATATDTIGVTVTR